MFLTSSDVLTASTPPILIYTDIGLISCQTYLPRGCFLDLIIHDLQVGHSIYHDFVIMSLHLFNNGHNAQFLVLGAVLSQLELELGFIPLLMTCRADASLPIPGGQEFHFPHISSNCDKFSIFFPQTLLISFLILALRVGDSPTREGPSYATDDLPGTDSKPMFFFNCSNSNFH